MKILMLIVITEILRCPSVRLEVVISESSKKDRLVFL